MSKNQPPKQPKSMFFDPMEIQNYYQCAYCRTHFLPKKRFVQKYCSESCRVMACRARKNGQLEDVTPNLRGMHTPQQHTTPPTQHKPHPKAQHTIGMEELIQHLEKRDKELQKKIDKIQTQQHYHMLISALAPILGEPIRQGLTKLFQGKQTPLNLEQFLLQIEKESKNLPPDIKLKVIHAAKEYWENTTQNTTAEKTGLPKPDELKNTI